MLSLVHPIQLEVISYLEIEDKKTLRTVCKHFLKVIDENVFCFVYDKKGNELFSKITLQQELESVPEIIRTKLGKLRLNAEDNLKNIFAVIPTSLTSLELHRPVIYEEAQMPTNLRSLKVLEQIAQ